jgi:hypothetical protein
MIKSLLNSRFFAERHNEDVVKLGGDVTPNAMAAIISLLYEGRAEIDNVLKIPELRAAAKKLQMMDLLTAAGMVFQFDDGNLQKMTGPVLTHILNTTKDSGNGSEALEDETDDQPLAKFRKKAAVDGKVKRKRGRPAKAKETTNGKDVDTFLMTTEELGCDICWETFETKEMRNDHNNLFHGDMNPVDAMNPVAKTTDSTPEPIPEVKRKRRRPTKQQVKAKKSTLDINNLLTVETLAKEFAPNGLDNINASKAEMPAKPSALSILPSLVNPTEIESDICLDTFENKESCADPTPNLQPTDTKKSVDLEKKNPESDTENRYKCGQCPSMFATIKSLKLHAVAHTKEINKHHACGLCGVKFPFVQQLNLHLVRAHTDGVKVLKMSAEVGAEAATGSNCVKCNKTFATPLRLHYHRLKFHGKHGSVLLVKERPKCGDCKITFMNRLGMDRHRCEKSGLLPCQYCNLRFAKEKFLDRHVDEQHSSYDVDEYDFL